MMGSGSKPLGSYSGDPFLFPYELSFEHYRTLPNCLFKITETNPRTCAGAKPGFSLQRQPLSAADNSTAFLHNVALKSFAFKTLVERSL